MFVQKTKQNKNPDRSEIMLQQKYKNGYNGEPGHSRASYGAIGHRCPPPRMV